ncbi:MAG TPA: NAD(P)/FAD-dependent oxidoreductase [Terriglobales bacterium]|nr:NAD(P)/FAD-dependent oxidoreductase [Terriglobales bacterium]
MQPNYDLIVIGGGIAGSSLARRVAAAGHKVLVLERETEFRDRIRGEALQPWGVAEARTLGISQYLMKSGQELRYFNQIINGQPGGRRDLVNTTPSCSGIWAFYHPRAQETLLQVAADAGAEVRRGATATQIRPGQTPTVRVQQEGKSAEVTARLVAVCAGRNAGLRTELGFTVRRGNIPLFLCGVWLTNVSRDIDPSSAHLANDLRTGSMCAFFMQPGNTARAYFGFHPQTCPRLQGAQDFPRFKNEFMAASGGAIPFGDAKPEGPLASFECADVWVDYPYKDGVALVGDAAASNDPSWGQGLALSFRDARVLSEELLANDLWTNAAQRYARRHDEYYLRLRTVTGWFYDLFQRLGPEAAQRRARALPLIAQDRTRVPDHLFGGLDIPLYPNSRARFFGEDTLAASHAG